MGLLLIGLCFAVIAGIGRLIESDASQFVELYLGEMTFYPASTTFIFGTTGILLAGFWILFIIFDSKQKTANGRHWIFLKRYSRFSLTTYIVHHAIHVWPLYLLALYEGRSDIWWYFEDAMSTPTALILSLLFIICFYGILILMEKRRKYGFEGMIRWLSEP